MSPVFLLFVSIGTILMGIPLLLMMRHDGISAIKGVMATILLTIAGVSGIYLMFWIENGYFGGLSFFGAVFMVPIFFVPISYVLRIPYGRLTDICTVGGCVMLALMKVHCYRSGCCNGRMLGSFRFPSHWVELVTSLLIGVVLIVLFYQSPQRRGTLYGWYLLLYGSTRFALNFLRQEWESPQRIPMGTIWSVVAVICGILWIRFGIRKKSMRAQQKDVSEETIHH